MAGGFFIEVIIADFTPKKRKKMKKFKLSSYILTIFDLAKAISLNLTLTIFD